MCWLYAITKYRYVPNLKEILSAINDAKRLGFKYLELEGVDSQLFIVAKNKEAIKRRCEENELKLIDFIPVLPGLMSTDSKKRRKALKDFRIGCELATYFEADMVHIATFHPPIYIKPPYDISEEYRFSYSPPLINVDPKFDFWRFFNEVVVRSVGECSDIAGDYGLKICIEPRTWETISNAWALELLFREVKSSNLGAILDVAHLAAQKMAPTQCVEMLGKRILYVHASDSNFLTEDHLEIGKGRINWKNLLMALKKHGFDGYIGIDVGGKEEMKPNLDLIYMNSKRYLEGLMRKLSI